MDYAITPDDVRRARELFEANEPRDLFYRAAVELVGLALQGSTTLTIAESVAVLLQTWNRAYYQYRKFDRDHFADIDQLLSEQLAALKTYRNRTIDDWDDQQEREKILNLFRAFELVLGPVGAAKALHLLAPKFFPLWDRNIATAYDLPLGKAGTNGERYLDFMSKCQNQYRELQGHCENPLKAIDEYNYCKYTKRWMS